MMRNRVVLAIICLTLAAFVLLINTNRSLVSGSPPALAEALHTQLLRVDVPVEQVRLLDESPLHVEVVLDQPKAEIDFETQWGRFLAEYETEVLLGAWLVDQNLVGDRDELLALYDIVLVDAQGSEVDRSTQFLYPESIDMALRSLEPVKTKRDDEVQADLQASFDLEEMAISSTIALESLEIDSEANLSGNPRSVRMTWVATTETDLLDVFRVFGGVFSHRYADLEIDFVRVRVVDERGVWLADYGGNFNLGRYTFRLSDELSNLSTPPMPPVEE